MLCTIGWQQSRCWEGTLTGLALHKQSQAGQSGTLCQKRGIGLLQGDFNLLVEKRPGPMSGIRRVWHSDVSLLQLRKDLFHHRSF